MSAEWKAVVGFEDLYEVSDHGDVRSLARATTAGRILKPGAKPTGHLLVALSRAGRPRTRAVHRLVLEAFVGPRPEGMECRHLDGNPANNQASNLRWGTHSENERDAVRHGTHNNARKTHCPRNHPYDEENTMHSCGQRICRSCRRA